jgi:CubicO group peptidase (beta-lactamase class C family)
VKLTPLTGRDNMSSFIKTKLSIAILVLLCFQLPFAVFTQAQDVQKKLKGFDQYMEKVLKDWNVPGIGVGIVVKDQLVFARGYGYRDYEKKLPVTPNTLYQIASNTKLFTSMAIGLLVEEKKLDWDEPVRQYVPIIQFYNDELNNTITIRDMLSHRTGISRHDMIWYKSDFTRKELFDRLKYLEPSQPLRQGFLYNNMMYAASGYIIEILTQKTWEDFVRERIFKPLDMNSTVFTIKEMEQNPDHGVPYNEKRDTTLLYRIPFYEEAQGVGPAGSIISSIQDMSHWLIALMNGGKYEGRQVIPENVVKATLEPSIALPNTSLENKGYEELLNSVYGMGRWFASYRGHYLTYHGGDIDGFHSQISCMPYDSIGVIVFVIGDHGAPLYNVISYNIYERLLGLKQTPWSERRLEDRIKGKQAGREGRQKAGQDRIANTRPSHPLSDYAGQYEHPAYGILTISKEDTALQFNFHKIKLPLYHYHYDRFDTPDDEQYGLWSLNFYTNPQGDIDRVVFSLDESEATFVRKADASLTDPNVLKQYAGKYEIAGTTVEVILQTDNSLHLSVPGQPLYELVPVKTHTFRIKQFADYTFVFVVENGQVKGLKQIDPSGEYLLEKKP